MLRTAWRQLCRQPRIASLIVLTIAAAIAVNTAMFSLADELLFRDPPFPDPHRIIHVEVDRPALILLTPTHFGPQVLRMEELVRDSGLLVQPTRAVIRRPYDATAEAVVDWGVRSAVVSPEFLDLFGVRPVFGSGLTEEDSRTNPRAVLIGHDLWRVRFGADPDIVGRVLALPGLAERQQWRVVGVMPSGFSFPSGTNLWIAAPQESGTRPYVPTFARLSPGVTLEQVRATIPYVTVTSLADHMRPRGAEALPYLLGAGGLLLLVAWVHVGGLMFSQAALRSSEIGVRLALGASRRRLFGEFAAEAALVSGAALLLAWFATPALVHSLTAILPPEVTLGRSVQPDWRTFAYASLLSLVGVSAISLVPAGLVRRAEPARLLRGNGPLERPGSISFRTSLLTLQVGLATALFYIAGLGLQSFAKVTAVDVGFNPDRLFGVSIPAPEPGSTNAEYVERVRRSVEALRRLPGVHAATTANNWPMDGAATDWLPISVTGRPDIPPIEVRNWWVGEGYAAVMGASLLEGAEPSSEEMARTPGPPGVGLGLATRSLATQLAGAGPVIGLVVRDRSIPVRIVAVIDDLKVTAADDGVEPALLVYYPGGAQGRVLLLRLSSLGDTEATVLGTLGQIWGTRAPRRLVRVDELVAESVAGYRAQAGILFMVAVVALGLTAVGLAGVVHLATRARTREIAIRVAMGARPRSVRLLMMRSVAWASVGGVALGVATGVGSGRLIQAHLYGVTAASWPVFGGVIVFLVGCCWLAAYLPAAHATRVDPAVALRHP